MIQGHQIKRRVPLVTLSFKSRGSLPRNRAICLAGVTIALRLDSSRSFYIASRDPEVSVECNTLNIMYHASKLRRINSLAISIVILRARDYFYQLITPI